MLCLFLSYVAVNSGMWFIASQSRTIWPLSHQHQLSPLPKSSYQPQGSRLLWDGCRSGVGVTKAPFVNFSVTGNFDLVKV